MNTQRIIVVLVGLTLGMQGLILYRQYAAGKPSSRPEIVSKAAPGVSLDLAGIPIKGNSEAKLFLIEFSDYECPFCERHANGVAKELDREFLESGKVRIAFVNNPLPMHNQARLLASAAICAGKQDLFWQVHQLLFHDKPRNRNDIMASLKPVPLKMPEFQSCLENPEVTRKIDSDLDNAKKLGLEGTPSFALGWADSQGRVKVEKYIRGAQPFSVFQENITKLIAEHGAM